MTTNLASRLAVAQESVKRGQLRVAEAELRDILRERPGEVSVALFLSALLLRMNLPNEAARELIAIREIAPDRSEATALLAAVRKAQDDLPGAIELYQELIRRGQGTADVYNQLGACWLGLEDAVAAGSAFRRAIELDRSVAHSYFNLGMALKLGGKSFETFVTFQRAIELDPGFHEGYVELWQQTRELLNWHEGLPILEDGLRRFPASVQMRVMLASVYGSLGRTEEAEALYREAVAIDPAARSPYAHWLQEEGRFEEALPILETAIRHDPVQGLAYYSLAVAKRFEVGEMPLIDLALPLVDHARLASEERMFLHYALAKAYEHRKEYECAMRQYDAANELAYGLYNAGGEIDAETARAERKTLAELYTRETFDGVGSRGSESRVPIFIVGMIRTGTTLLDQILATHPDVATAGEQPFWHVSAGRVNRRWVESGIDGADLATLGSDYLDILRHAAGDAPRIVDKMPTNFAHIGLMSATFPEAKFVHIRRSPLDTCLSVYTTFLGRDTQFAYRQANIVAYYRDYLRTMEHWRAVLPPGRMIEIDYEEFVSDQEATLRELLGFLGLPWDDALLRHHERSGSQVSTPSLWTARQPVNAGSVERWRRYEPWLGELLQLRDVAHPPRTRTP